MRELVLTIHYRSGSISKPKNLQSPQFHRKCMIEEPVFNDQKPTMLRNSCWEVNLIATRTFRNLKKVLHGIAWKLTFHDKVGTIFRHSKITKQGEWLRDTLGAFTQIKMGKNPQPFGQLYKPILKLTILEDLNIVSGNTNLYRPLRTHDVLLKHCKSKLSSPNTVRIITIKQHAISQLTKCPLKTKSVTLWLEFRLIRITECT